MLRSYGNIRRYFFSLSATTARFVYIPILAGLLLSTGFAEAVAQVSIAPTALFLDDQSRSATLYVSNGTDQTQQVEVDFRFGYPAADSAGNVFMQYEDNAAEAQYSLRPYLRVFPRQFTLPGGESQVVRIMTRPLSEKEDGVYWTRLITTSEPQVEEIDTTTSGVQARVNFRIRQITSVLYRKGKISTEVGIGDLQVSADSNVVAITTDLNRSGNAPFLGMAHLKVKREDTTVLEADRAMAAYFSMRRQFTLEHSEELLPGAYTAEIRLTSDRSDIPQQHRIPIDPISRTVQFQVE